LFDSESKLREAIQKMLEPKQYEQPIESAGGQNLDDLFK
jgi:hypothetical protein